jgi:hypothetical protein
MGNDRDFTHPHPNPPLEGEGADVNSLINYAESIVQSNIRDLLQEDPRAIRYNPPLY